MNNAALLPNNAIVFISPPDSVKLARYPWKASSVVFKGNSAKVLNLDVLDNGLLVVLLKLNDSAYSHAVQAVTLDGTTLWSRGLSCSLIVVKASYDGNLVVTVQRAKQSIVPKVFYYSAEGGALLFSATLNMLTPEYKLLGIFKTTKMDCLLCESLLTGTGYTVGLSLDCRPRVRRQYSQLTNQRAEDRGQGFILLNDDGDILCTQEIEGCQGIRFRVWNDSSDAPRAYVVPHSPVTSFPGLALPNAGSNWVPTWGPLYKGTHQIVQLGQRWGVVSLPSGVIEGVNIRNFECILPNKLCTIHHTNLHRAPQSALDAERAVIKYATQLPVEIRLYILSYLFFWDFV